MDDKKKMGLDDNELDAVVGGSAAGVVEREPEISENIDLSILTGEEREGDASELEWEGPRKPKRK